MGGEGVADRLGYPVAGLPDDGVRVGDQRQVVPVAEISRMSTENRDKAASGT